MPVCSFGAPVVGGVALVLWQSKVVLLFYCGFATVQEQHHLQQEHQQSIRA